MLLAVDLLALVVLCILNGVLLTRADVPVRAGFALLAIDVGLPPLQVGAAWGSGPESGQGRTLRAGKADLKRIGRKDGHMSGKVPPRPGETDTVLSWRNCCWWRTTRPSVVR